MKRGRLLIILLLVALGMGLLAWTLSPSVEGTRFTLANGDQLIFRAVTVGSNSTHCFGNVFQRMAARIPGPLGDKLTGGTVARVPNEGGTNVGFWFLRLGGGTLSTAIKFRVVDEQGLDADPYLDGYIVHQKDNDFGFYYDAAPLPRRSRVIRLRVVEESSKGEVRTLGELRIPNPPAGDYPQWTPEPLPAMRRFGEMSVALEEINISLDSHWRDLYGVNMAANVAHMRVRVAHAGQPTDDWAFLGARCSDATGDFSPAWYTLWERRDVGVLDIWGPWALWPGENPVKLKTLWVRKETQPPERVVLFFGVPLPATFLGMNVIASTNHPFGELKILCATYPGQGPLRRVLQLSSSDPRFYRYEDPEVETYFFQEARDEKLQPLERIDARSFRVPSDAKSVDLAIHLPKAKRADFVISPKLISTNLPPGRE